jgi:thioredoxin reductase
MPVPATADVIIIGGGPAGLNCALILGRCRRRVLVFDDGRQRNKASRELHGFITRDGIRPDALLRLARADCKKYDVNFVNERVVTLSGRNDGFTVTTAKGRRYQCRKVLLATGLNDLLPPFQGFESYYGKSAFHCPFCDGFERSSKPWAVYATSSTVAVENCLRYLNWTKDVTLLAHDVDLKASGKRKLESNSIKIAYKRVAALEGGKGVLRAIRFIDGTSIPATALFFSIGSKQCSDLAVQMNCERTSKGVLKLNRLQQTSVKGLYVAGDMARDVQLSVIAAAEGAKAGVAIHLALNKEERH